MSTAQKISQLTTAGPLTGAELVPIVQTSGTLQTTVSTIAAFAVVSIVPVVSALGTQIAQVSAIASANTVAITSVEADVSALEIQVATVSARTSVNAAAITSINNVVSAIDVRVSVLEVAVSNIGNVSAIAALVSTVTSLEAVVSALVIQTANVSALTSVNSAAITSVNDTVSALEVRVSTVSAAVSALQIQVAAVSALTSVNAASITSINAVVSTKVNRVGDYMDSVQYIEFDTSTSFATSVGRLTWDITHGTLDLGLIGGNANLLLGQREVVYCYNNSGATILKGKVVQVTGASGQRLTIDLAQADSDLNSLTVLGVTLENVSVNSSGFVATDGVVNNVDTSNFTDGQIVFLSPVSAGELTATKPVAPQHMVQIGYVVKGGSVGGGSIYAKVQNGYELGELHDVKTSSSASIANNEVLAYNTSAGVWTNSTVLLDVQASVSALNVQIAAVSALTSVNAASVSALQVQVNAVSAALTSTNNVVSALEVRVSTVSAAAAATQTQVNAVSVLVSALDVRVAAVSASVSALQVQVNAVSAVVSAALVSVGQRVLKAGDTMTGALNISTSADAQAVSVAGYATFSSRVSISAGFYTGLQNYQDVVLQRAAFKDYALAVVAKGSVSATVSLDLTEGNYFTAIAAGSTTFVFANPPVSVSGATGLAAGGFILELANGGAATVTWPSATKWPSGTAPTLTSSGTDVFVFITDDGGTIWRGVQSMKDSK